MVNSVLLSEARRLGRGGPPCGFDGDPTNLRRYVGNGPTNATDPSGNEPQPLPNQLAGNTSGQNMSPGAQDRLRYLTSELQRYSTFLADNAASPDYERLHQGIAKRQNEIAAEIRELERQGVNTYSQVGPAERQQAYLAKLQEDRVKNAAELQQIRDQLENATAIPLKPVDVTQLQYRVQRRLELQEAYDTEIAMVQGTPTPRQMREAELAKWKAQKEADWRAAHPLPPPPKPTLLETVPEQDRPYAVHALALMKEYDLKSVGSPYFQYLAPPDFWLLIPLGEDTKTDKHLQIVAEIIFRLGGKGKGTSLRTIKQIEAIHIYRMGENAPALYRSPDTIRATTKDYLEGVHRAEFLNGLLTVGEYIPIVKTAIKIDKMIEKGRRNQGITVWDCADVTFSFADDVLTVSGPLLKTAELSANGIRIITIGRKGVNAAEVASAAEKATAAAVDKALVEYIGKPGNEKVLAEFAEKQGGTFLKEGEAASKTVAAEEKTIAKTVEGAPRSGPARGMTGESTYKLPESIAKELEDPTKVKYYDNLAREQMKSMGIPEEMIGDVPGTFGEGKGAFSPTATSGGTHTPPLVEGKYTPRINVDAAVLDPNNPLMTSVSPSWKTASVEARMQAVAAHEYTEALLHQAGRNGAYPQAVRDAIVVAMDPSATPAAAAKAIETIHNYGHLGAIAQAPDVQALKLLPEAKQILIEYRQAKGLVPK